MESVKHSNDPTGTVDEAVVERVLQYGADLALVKAGTRGYLHISRLREEFTPPPLGDLLHLGDVLSVVVGRFDIRHNCWEVSHRAYLRRRKLESLGLIPNEKRVGEIQRATELGCTLRLEGITAFLPAPAHPWSKYRVLWESGRLVPREHMEVIVGRWSAEAEGLMVRLPPPRVGHISTQICNAKVLLLRPSYIKKNRERLQSVVYAELDGPDIARIEVTDLLDVEADFPVGANIPVRAEKIDVYTNLIAATIAWEQTRFATPRALSIGTVRTAPVIWTAPNGAYCLLENRVTGFIRSSSVIGTVRDGLNKYLHAGDTVEVRVLEQAGTLQGNCHVEFIRTVDQVFPAQGADDPLPIDLGVVRRSGTAGGFTRDASFRLNILDTYNHRCCICGLRYVILDSSAMEAAHVVPRGNRGGNLLQNGLCLCSVHHWAFDRGLLAIDDDLSIRVATVVLAAGEDAGWLTKLHGEDAYIEKDAPISRAALAWHRRNVFLDA